MGHNCDLYFPLPEQKKASNEDIKVVLDIFRRTLNDLPFGDLEKAAKEIFDILYKSNKIEFKGEDRQALLTEIEQPAAHVLHGLREKIKDVSTPIGRSDERIAKILVAIHYELALGYRCLFANPPVNGLMRSVDKVDTANSIRLSIYHLGEVLRTKYAVFSNPSGAIWSYIYTFYICAHSHGVDKITLPSSALCRFNTVEEVFKSILLLSVSSPLTMRSNEFAALYDLAPELIKHIDLGKIKCGKKYTDLMTFNLSGTEPPKKQFATGCDSCSNSSNCFAISTTPLINYIDQQQDRNKTGEQITSIQTLLDLPNQLDNLKRNLAGSARIGSAKRIKEDGLLVDIVVGFSDAYTFLQQGNDGVANETDETIEIVEPTNWETINDESITVEVSEGWTATGIIRAGLRKTSAKMINRSSGGYCLYIDATERFSLRVGELAILQEEGEGEWQAAEIKWVRGGKKRIDLGVKLLDGLISFGTFRPKYSKDTDISLDCIILTNDSDLNRSAIRLITASSDLKRGDQLLLNHQGEEHKITVSRINSKANGYVEYSCDLSMHEEAAVAKQPLPSGESDLSETDFESIWDLL